MDNDTRSVSQSVYEILHTHNIFLSSRRKRIEQTNEVTKIISFLHCFFIALEKRNIKL